jgi:hypothetical protein
MKRILLLAPAALGALTISVNARDDRLPAKFVGDWCLAEHTADHLSFYRRGRCTNPDGVDDWLTISPDRFDAHEMRCMVLVAHPNKRGDYLVKVGCDDNLIQNYWFSLFNDRLKERRAMSGSADKQSPAPTRLSNDCNDETPQVHHPTWRCSGGVAARGACAKSKLAGIRSASQIIIASSPTAAIPTISNANAAAS